MHSIEWQLFTNFSTIYPRFHREIGDIVLCVIFDRACVDTRDNRSCRNEYLMSNELSAIKKVEELIIAAIESNATSLEINYFDISRIPDIIGQATSLQTLKISGIQVSKLPDSIGYLTNLEELYINAGIECLPHTIDSLANLSLLTIVDYNLRYLPDNIGSLSSLKHLNFYTDSLLMLPKSIGNLSNLEVLNLFCSEKLECLPDSIGYLSKLKELKISASGITKIPDTIGNLSSLEEISFLSNYQLSYLPDTIGDLMQLKSLELYDSNITYLPNTIGKLSNLVYMKISGNPISKLPDTIGRLSNLNSLYLDRNQLTDLPAILTGMQSLSYLNLSNNQFDKLPPSLEQLKNLSVLELEGIDRISDLSVLQKLSPDFEVMFLNEVWLPRRYWTKLSEWKSEWLLDEQNAEIRRVLIQRLGYERICEELNAIEIDTWREYTLLKINVNVDKESIVLLKMTCPSTTHIHVLRVPPKMKTAEAAISWVNWGIHPDKFSLQT